MIHPSILVAEDDPAIGKALKRTLNHEGYDVRLAVDGAEAWEMLVQQEADLVILDVAMPFLSGLEVCRRLRSVGNRTPVLMLTARHTVDDRVEGLDAGADDYLAKPFSLDELLARIRALLRRAKVTGVALSRDVRDVLSVGDVQLDRAGRTVDRAGLPVRLTKTEFDLLELLMENKGIVLSRDVIYERVWGFYFETASKSLDIYIGYLRRKLEANGGERFLHTVRGVGYVARDP